MKAHEKSGLTQAAFALQWCVSPVPLGTWLSWHAKDGPRGLERLAEGPPKRRGKALSAEALQAEVVSAERRYPSFGP